LGCQHAGNVPFSAVIASNQAAPDRQHAGFSVRAPTGLAAAILRGVSHSVGYYSGIIVISNGRASGRGASGTFRRSDSCSGTWTSSKQ